MYGRNGLLALITILAVSLLVTGCGQAQSPQGSNLNDPWGVVTVTPGKTLMIGVALSNTDSRSEDAELARGAKLAFQHYKTVAGFPIELVAIHTECSAIGGQAAAAAITGDAGIVAVIGPDCSSACQSSTPILDEAHYTAISPGCAASSLSDPALHVGAFVRTVYPDAVEGYLAAQYAYRELGARRVAIISDGSLETEGATEVFESRMTSLGGKIIAKVTFGAGETNMQAALADIGSQKIDLIYAPLMAADAATLVTQRQTVTGLSGVPLLGGRYYWSDRLIQTTNQSADGVYATGPYTTTALLDDANSSYQSLYNQPPPSPSYAYAYDAVSILIEALNKVALKGGQGSLVIGRKALQDAIYSTANYPGLTGNLTCTSWGDCGIESVAVGQVQNGKWVTIYIP